MKCTLGLTGSILTLPYTAQQIKIDPDENLNQNKKEGFKYGVYKVHLGHRKKCPANKDEAIGVHISAMHPNASVEL